MRCQGSGFRVQGLSFEFGLWGCVLEKRDYFIKKRYRRPPFFRNFLRPTNRSGQLHFTYIF